MIIVYHVNISIEHLYHAVPKHSNRFMLDELSFSKDENSSIESFKIIEFCCNLMRDQYNDNNIDIKIEWDGGPGPVRCLTIPVTNGMSSVQRASLFTMSDLIKKPAPSKYCMYCGKKIILRLIGYTKTTSFSYVNQVYDQHIGPTPLIFENAFTIMDVDPTKVQFLDFHLY